MIAAIDTTIDIDALDLRAIEILRGNDKGGYTIPTSGLYPYQWNWDSAFAAFGFGTFDLDRAWEEVRTLFNGQWGNGMVPHILFHQADDGYFPGADIWGCKGPVPSSGISQPPVAAMFIRKLWERDKARFHAELDALFPKLVLWHRWFMTWRRERACDAPDGAGAIVITHPWEAGRDNAPDWDDAMEGIDPTGVVPYTRRDTSHVDASMRPTSYDYDRYLWLVQMARGVDWDEAAILEKSPFRVADPTMTFTLLRGHRDLLVMGKALGQDTREIEGWITDLEAAAKTLWNPEINSYDARNVRTGQFSGSVSNASFLCWLGGLDDDRMLAQFDRVMDAAPFGMASFDPAHEKFDSRRYWRGPIWAVVNTLIGIGLEDQGHQSRADRLRASTMHLIANNGFAEYFDPTNGAPAGGDSFTWTAAVWLAWVREYKG